MPEPKLEVVAGKLPDPPYPADTCVHGWHFYVDVIRMTTSDSWTLCAPEFWGQLALLWIRSWLETPAGSYPNDNALIAAKIGMTTELFDGHRTMLMRGWYRASDNRLYHPYITKLVLGRLGFKENQRLRKVASRERVRFDSKGKQGLIDDGHVASQDVTVTNRDGHGVGVGVGVRTKDLKPIVRSDARTAPGFDQFWSTYPATKRRVAKAKCRDIWQAKKLEPLAPTIIAHVAAMALTQQWLDGYEPAPLTYLNQKRWEDELPAAPQKRKMSL